MSQQIEKVYFTNYPNVLVKVWFKSSILKKDLKKRNSVVTC